MNILKKHRYYLLLLVIAVSFNAVLMFTPPATAASIWFNLQNDVAHKSNAIMSGVIRILDLQKNQFIPSSIQIEKNISLDGIEPSSGQNLSETDPDVSSYRFSLEDRKLTTDAVLVPIQKAVISSSRDGKIKDIYVHNGDLFKRGDLLLEYVCADVNGEKKVIEAKKNIVDTKVKGSFRLMKLGLISNLEKTEMDAEKLQVEAQADIVKARINDCQIRAPFDGRVTNRLANPNEYTRTDRVLIEIADTQSMNIQFVVPSRWLRWINVNAPISVYLDDMDQNYEGEVIRIHGEVDPVSETVQVVGTINTQGDNLLPGMSGTITLDSHQIREQNIHGILEQKIGR